MRVVCFGDSLALPREGCLYPETWIAKLKCAFPEIDFLSNFCGGMLIKDLERYWDYMCFAESDVVIIQEGICDCAPRYLNDERLSWKVVLKIIQKLGLTSLFWKVVKHGSRSPNCTFTSQRVFEIKYNDLLERMYGAGVQYVVIIKIGHGAPSVVKRSQFFNSNVDKFNSVFDSLKEKYQERLFLIDPLNQVDEDMFVDGYHCNAKGMDLVFHELSDILSAILPV